MPITSGFTYQVILDKTMGNIANALADFYMFAIFVFWEFRHVPLIAIVLKILSRNNSIE